MAADDLPDASPPDARGDGGRAAPTPPQRASTEPRLGTVSRATTESRANNDARVHTEPGRRNAQRALTEPSDNEVPDAMAANLIAPTDAAPSAITAPEVSGRRSRPALAVPPAPSLPLTLDTPDTRITPPAPRLLPEPARDLSAPDLYLSRELTYLSFCARVLHESADARTPLLERLKFIAIVSGNLDEFFQKRIGGLKQQIGAQMHATTADGRTPAEQVEDCLALIADIERKKAAVSELVLAELAPHVQIARYDELARADKQALRAHYVANVFPLVTPQAIDPAHPFPFISNLSINLLVTLRPAPGADAVYARVKVPVAPGVPRFVRLGQTRTFVDLVDVMAQNLDLLFPRAKIIQSTVFRVTRNAVVGRAEHEADDLLEMIESEMRARMFAPVVRLQVERSMPKDVRLRLARELELDAADVVEAEGRFGQHDLMELATLDIPELRDPPHAPCPPVGLVSDNLFADIRAAGSLLLSHPYESFALSVERFVREAADDADVLAIKMTLYRTSKDSEIIRHLVRAARNGKQVAVVLELKARFDEEANIRWASRMERAGIHVTYGVVGLKTHCKVMQVVRREGAALVRYMHIGTGNYHAGTARLYTDWAFFSCDKHLGADVTELFNYLTTGIDVDRTYARLLVAPSGLKAALLAKVEREMEHAAAGRPARIFWKMNALEDVDLVRALYRASQAGVKVDLLVRDTCRLRPGVPGVSETIRVVSIVGRFLEHSRAYTFANGGALEVFIGSADAMQRNLERRVEVLVPITEARHVREIMEQLELQWADQRGAWDMQADGSYVLRGELTTEGRDGREVRDVREGRVSTNAGTAAAKHSQEQLIERIEARAVAEFGADRSRWPSPLMRRGT